MDTSVLVAALVCLAVLVGTLLFFFQNKPSQPAAAAPADAPGTTGPQAAQGGRNARRRGLDRLQQGAGGGGGGEGAEVVAAARAELADEDDDDDEDEEEDGKKGGKKIGAKKAAKLAMKEQARQDRERAAHLRAEREAAEQLRMEKEKEAAAAEAAAEALEQKKLEEAEAERKKKEQEEYEKIKASFSVEGAGTVEELSAEESQSLLTEFVNFIKNKKVVLLEDIGAHFHLKTKDVVARIQGLEEAGHITGFMDDRGKYVHVTPEELKNVAKWIRQRGRVSLSDLVDSSNSLVRLSEDK